MFEGILKLLESLNNSRNYFSSFSHHFDLKSSSTCEKLQSTPFLKALYHPTANLHSKNRHKNERVITRLKFHSHLPIINSKDEKQIIKRDNKIFILIPFLFLPHTRHDNNHQRVIKLTPFIHKTFFSIKIKTLNHGEKERSHFLHSYHTASMLRNKSRITWKIDIAFASFPR